MTRINCVPPSELCRQHLIAEYKELPRIFGMMRRAQTKGTRYRIPSRYVLGTGHMTFFVDKGAYLLRRQREIVAEMLRRGYHPTYQDVDRLADGVDRRFLGDWTPDDAAMAMNRARIAERLKEMGEVSK